MSLRPTKRPAGRDSIVRNPIQTQLDNIIGGSLRLQLDITAEDGSKLGELRALTQAHLDDPSVIQKLTDWRNQNMGNFLTHFVATPERTRNWLRNVVFKAQGQLLFLVCVDDQVAGHLGFKDLTCDDVLLDNAMRGERMGHPKLFVMAGRVLNEWLFREAGVQTIYGYVMTQNATAVMMNKQIGFGGWVRHPLVKNMRRGEAHWEIGAEGAVSPDDRYCYKIVLTRPGTAL